MDIVTGHVGSAHVTSWQDRDLNQGIFGPDTYILNVGSKLAATIISNNEIRIADGALVMQGCQGVIQKGTYDTISIDNGTQGMKRNDLICAQYTKSAGVESMSLVVIKGTAASTPVDPSYTSGDIQNGDTPVQVPVYRAVLDGLTLTSVDAMVDTQDNVSDIATSLGSVGETYKDSFINVSADSSLTKVAHITVPAGVYVTIAYARFFTAAGDHQITILGGGVGTGGIFNAVKVTSYDVIAGGSIISVMPSGGDISLFARNSSGSQSVSGSISAVRIK